MSRFVILQHELAPPDGSTHWDFMLEQGEVLRTWALAAEPQPDCEIAARALVDHRPKYLDYQGPISNNRGNVRQWDAGEYELLAESPTEISVKLKGRRLIGAARLRRSAADDQRWIFWFSV